MERDEMDWDDSRFTEKPPTPLDVADGDYSEQDREWLDIQRTKMVTQKGLLYFSFDQYKDFLDTGTLTSL